ncbi:MAG: 4-hydroxy-3-methylbut-2-enyl diphosphate reductase [Candidatus Cryptobacteroides sp.]|nr:4-hydroxy-3-methylbut-2-enyl diphosphate reductase [Bacteroidales bacterium]
MAFNVEIDSHSGFCGGVIRAISEAENILSGAEGRRLYSLGAIVHNDAELSRLEAKGLSTINIESLSSIPEGSRVLFRAHGEPPSTYSKARERGLEIIDCTCPVVLKLQRSIAEAYERTSGNGGQIIIFGKVGHAEVLGLLGQTDGKAIVIDGISSLRKALADKTINISSPIEVFSQTTKSPAEYSEICSALEEAMSKEHELSIVQFRGTGLLKTHSTICSQVAFRHSELSEFALRHDIVVFVSGKDSSNGKVLCELCKSLNIRTYHISNEDDVRPEWFRKDDRVGVCGATSTPQWQLEAVAERIMSFE